MKMRWMTSAFLAVAMVACGNPDGTNHGGRPGTDSHEHPAADDGSWTVTAWGEHFELFPEIDALVAGETASAYVHVTRLDGFAPVTDGTVTVVLGDASGHEERFSRSGSHRPGIFVVEIAPRGQGQRELRFELDVEGVKETIPGGTVRVGTAESPGGLVTAAHQLPPLNGSEGIAFLKEQQWRTDFATAWVRTAALNTYVTGTARVEPPSGGAVVLTAPVDGFVQGQSWPYPGKRISKGDMVLSLIPATSTGRSLAELESVVREVEAYSEAADARVLRLERLLERQAVSRREVEQARAEATALRARLEAAQQELDAAEAGRRGRQGVPGLAIGSPFRGRVAKVMVSPGEHVAAGATLVRLVTERPVWARVALTPEDAGRLGDRISGLILDMGASVPPIQLPPEDLRMVAVAPEVDVGSGTVEALIEISRTVDELRPGLIATAQILLPAMVEGTVLPDSAVIDDAGVTVVYVQLDGESFARREVDARHRLGDRLLVEGLLPGERVVTTGGAAIRRASMMASGEAQGHVH
jgi:RND family efflux transporter MFP subunit